MTDVPKTVTGKGNEMPWGRSLTEPMIVTKISVALSHFSNVWMYNRPSYSPSSVGSERGNIK